MATDAGARPGRGQGRVVLADRAGGGLDAAKVDSLVDALAAAHAAGREVVLVSSGAIASGLAPLSLARRPRDLATQQAAASVGQGLLVHRYTESFARHGVTVGQVLLTTDDVVRRGHYRNAQRTLYRLLDLGVLPVVNENDTVATEEIRFGDNDRLAALVAHLVRAELLVLLSDVDGLYEGDPRRAGVPQDHRGDGRLRPRRRAAGPAVAGRASGTGGMASKVAAAKIAAAAGVRALVAAADEVGPALAGDVTGTSFAPAVTRLPTRMLWLAYATTARGRLHLDAGAVRAVVDRRLSLLAAGVTAVDGAFVAGDPVDLLDQNGNTVARGLVNFDVTELPGLLGRSTPDLARELGPAFGREVVHRDDIVLLGR